MQRRSTQRRALGARAARLGAAALIGVALGAGAALVDAGGAGADSAAGFYLALGASASVGYQPTVAEPTGEPTDEGYANDLVAYEASRGVDLALTQLGCPGESTLTMITGDDACYQSHGSQLAAATAFLEDHRGEPGIVTVDLGFNNLVTCLRQKVILDTCVETHLLDVRVQMSEILADLQAAAGPQVTIVGLGHYDPFVVDGAGGGAGAVFAKKSVEAMDRLNEALRDVYRDAGVPMADVAAAFGSDDRGSVGTPAGTVEPRSVERVCALTWMCQSAPYGPDLHPNAEGYAVIAEAIEDVLPSPW